MTPTDLIRAAVGDGLVVTLSPAGTLRVIGAPEAVSRWRPLLVANKTAIVRHLAGERPSTINESRVAPVGQDTGIGTERGVAPSAGHPQARELPAWCRATCDRYEDIPEAGSGCLHSLEAGAWRTEWRALRTMAWCPKAGRPE